MQLDSPVDAVARAIHHAAFVALPDIRYQRRNLGAMKGWSAEQRMAAMRNNTVPMSPAVRRPDPTECQVFAMFAQTWGSTALGFGGIGGAAMTPAYTVVVKGPQGHLAVYWAGRFGYLIPPDTPTLTQTGALQDDLAQHLTVGRREAGARYGALVGHD